MCGIAGILGLNNISVSNLPNHLELMNEKQKHRGPDGMGIFTSPKHDAGFAHVRLSILDIVDGTQPMSDVFGNTIIFNGQIYNASELRREIGISYPFKTHHSDTEVILAGFKLWGEKILQRLEGMFAFVIYEGSTGNSFFARDHIGIKPFYYTIQGNNFLFASEAKTLLSFLPSKEIDEDALKDYLAFQYYTFDKTLFKGVKILEAGYYGTVQNGELKIQQYFDVSFANKLKITEAEAIEESEKLIINSVKKHLISDVPITSYVSGGIDSSLIASIAAKENKITEGWCGFFPNFPNFSENQHAKEVTLNAKIKLNEVPITEDDYIANLERVHFFLDTPMVGYGLLNNFKMAEAVSKKYKVVFSGSGGDEIFGGYSRYLIASLITSLKEAINGNNKDLENILPSLESLKNYKPMLNDLLKGNVLNLPEDELFYNAIGRMENRGIRFENFTPSSYSSFASFQKIFNAKSEATFFEKMCYFEQKSFLPSLLLMEDKLSMMNGLEARTPLIDKTIFEFVAKIPTEMKFKNGNLKHLLKKVAKKHLPENIFNRKDKMGFSSPMNIWIKNGKMKDFVMDILTSEKAKSRKHFNYEIAIKDFQSQSNFNRTLWGFLALELWQRNFLDSK